MKDLFIKRFQYYKDLGDKTFAQLSENELFWKYNEESNSIAIIVKHLSGNMLSRWTNFLTQDGEKSWRNRDQEFINSFKTKEEIWAYWEKGWKCLFDALEQITEKNINDTIFIRGEKHTLLDAVLRQLAHYPYHIGQMIFIAKMLKSDDWKTLSIARNKSEDFNKKMVEETENQENSSSVCFEKSPEVRDDYKTE